MSSGLLVGAFLTYTQIEQQSGNLRHANFLDDAGRSAFRFSSAGQRQDAEAWSNVALTLAVAWPVVVDPYLAGYVFPKWLHKSQPVAKASAGVSYWLPMVAEDTYGLTHLLYF